MNIWKKIGISSTGFLVTLFIAFSFWNFMALSPKDYPMILGAYIVPLMPFFTPQDIWVPYYIVSAIFLILGFFVLNVVKQKVSKPATR